MDPDESYTDFPINRTISTPLNSLYFISIENCTYRSPEEEMVNYFYKAMLKTIVDKMEATIPDSTESIPSGDRFFIKPNSTYVQACEEEELLLEREPDTINDSILESRTYVGQVPSKRRTTSLSKRDKRPPRRKSLKTKKKMNISNNTTPKFTTLTTSSQLRYNLDENLEEYVLMKFKNGNVYSGSVQNKIFHGTGEYRWSDGTVYKGDFLNGKITGTGKYTYSDLSIYEGQVYNSYPHGFGKYFLRHSTVAYSGQWYLGAKQGTGCIHFDHNNWYEGTWKSDLINGIGTRYYSSGSKYQGEFVGGKRHGNGCALLWNSDFYSGTWVKGRRNGYGQYIWKPFREFSFCIPAKNFYNGMWKHNCMHGKGELNFGTLNGSRYIGQFCFNNKHGRGLIICENGSILESNPMFDNNKPVQYSDAGELQSSECNDESPRTVAPSPQNDRGWIPESFEERSTQTPKGRINTTEMRNNFTVETKVFRYPSSILEKETRAGINLCKLQFHNKPQRMIPTSILFAMSPEDIDLNQFIRPLLEMIHGCTPLGKSDSFTEEPNTWEEVGVKMMSNKKVHYDYQEIYNIEERALRRAIHINLGRLREIYKQYSIIGCLKKLPYDTLMNRLFLWQMYRDCKISEKGISLSRIDVLLAEDSISFSECIHDPFENIYFWQFLTSLVKTAWEIYGNKGIKYMFEGRSILEEIFTKFLKEDIFPNVGHHLGAALFDYKDIIPMRSAYNWYKSIEEPMTVKTFVLNIFSLNKKETCRFEPVPKDFYLKNGKNISIGNQVVFLDEEEPKYCIGPKKEKIHPFAKKCLKKKLYFLREIGPKLIYKKIRSIVPGIFMNKECFNNEYQLCFLEFYEILLVCTQHILRKKDLRFKEQNTKISNVPDKHKTVAPKKSKQYRKSASHHSLGKQRPTS